MATLSESEFVGLLYDAALGRVPWPDVVTAMARIFDGGSAAIYASDPVRGENQIVGLHGFSPDFVGLYGNHFLQHDLWAQAFLTRRRYGTATLGEEIVPDAVWERSFIYNEFLRTRTGAFHIVGSMLKLNDGRLMAVGCHRPRSLEAFSQEARAQLDRLLPHLQRAAEVWQQLSLASGVRATLDRMAPGIMQLDSQRRITTANEAAEAMLKSRDGLSRVGASLRARRADEDNALQRLIAEAAATSTGDAAGSSGSGHLRISRPSGRRPYALLVSPMGLDRVVLSSSGPAVLLIVTDPEQQSTVDEHSLCELYDLSPTEARVVAGIVSGQSSREIALRLEVTFNTVRTLLTRAMAKTETNSQIELVRLVLAGPRAR